MAVIYKLEVLVAVTARTPLAAQNLVQFVWKISIDEHCFYFKSDVFEVILFGSISPTIFF